MSSQVKVQAHSSGQVKVTTVDPTQSEKQVAEVTLEPNQSSTFYASTTAKIIVEEIANPSARAG